MIKYALQIILFSVASLVILGTFALENYQYPSHYIHATVAQDTITVRFSPSKVYVLDYHPIAMQGNMRQHGSISSVDTLYNPRRVRYSTSLGEMTIPLGLNDTPLNFIWDNRVYKILP